MEAEDVISAYMTLISCFRAEKKRSVVTPLIFCFVFDYGAAFRGVADVEGIGVWTNAFVIIA